MVSANVKNDCGASPSCARALNFVTASSLAASSSDHNVSGASFEVTQYVSMECLKDVRNRVAAFASLLKDTCK